MDNQTDPATAGAPTDQPVYGPPPVETYSRTDDITPGQGYKGPSNIGSPAQSVGAVGTAIANLPHTIANASPGISANEAAPAAAVNDTFSPVGANAWQNFQNGLDVGKYAADTTARENALHDSITQAIADVQKASGAQIPSPYEGGFADEATQQVLARRNAGEPMNEQEFANQTWLAQLGLYQKSLQDLYDKHPGQDPNDTAIRAAIEPALNMTGYADQWVKDAQSKAQMDLAKSNGTLLPWLAQQGGEIAGGFRNPINLMGLLVGGPELGIAKSAVGRILEEGAGQAITQMGLTGAQEGEHQARAEQLGEEHGFWPIMHDLENSALGGFIGGSIIRGIHEIPNLFRSADQSVPTEEFLRRAQDLPPPGGWPAGSESRGQAWKREMDEWEAQRNASKGAVVPYEGPAGEENPLGWSVTQNADGSTTAPATASGEAPAQAPARPVTPTPALKTVPAIANLPKTTAVTAAGLEARELDSFAAPKIPPEQTPNQVLEAYTGLIKAGEAPDLIAKPLAPPRTPDELPPTDPSSLSLPSTASMKIGESFIKDDKPVSFETFDPLKLTTNANVFQYKGGGNQQGVTDRLKGVGQWDQMAGSDPMVVYQWRDGREDVSDGHQRTGLAKGLDAQGLFPEGTRSPGFLFKEADGWTPQDVRAYAAKLNLQKGSGDVLDSARILRERPDIWDKSLPTSDLKLKQAKGLAELSDDGWGMVVNGHVKPNLAALVGQGMPDKSAHTDLLQNIIDFKNADENSTRMMIADANAAGFREEEQNDIFGSQPITRSLLRERAEVYSRVIQALRDDKKVFGLLDREAERIEAAGNSLVSDVNVAQADRATQLASILEKLAVRQGPVSAALNRAASLVAEGAKAPVAARAFLRDIDRLMREEGLKLTPPAIPEPRTTLDFTKTPDQETATEELRRATVPLSDDMFGSQSKSIPDQHQAIFEDVRQKLVDTDMPADQAAANAAVMAAHYVARADRLGRTDPETLYRSDALQVRGGKMLSGKEEGFATARGSYTAKDAGDVINLFKKKNASTFMHEAGHKFLNDLDKDAAEDNAPQQIKDDLQTVLDWTGAKDFESMTKSQQEKFAKGFEQYLREGKAPSSALQRVFDQFKNWLRTIYRSLIGIGQEIPDKIRAVMDRMIATDDEIAAARGAAREASREPPATQAEQAQTQLASYARELVDGVNAALEEGGTPLDREARDLINSTIESMAPEPVEPGSTPPKPVEPIPMPGTKLNKTVDMRATGLRPKGRGDGASSIAAAQVAWSSAQQTGKNAIAAIGAHGWSVLRPTEGLAYGQPHIEVTPEGLARFYGQGETVVPADHFQINNSNDVPYGAGASNSSDVVNIDRHIPQFDDRVVGANGQPLDLYKYLAIHETTEKPIMERLIAEGMPVEKAYHIAHTQHATPAERAAVEKDGGNWDEYEKVMDGFLSHIEHEHPANPPPDLYTKPYPHQEAEFLKHQVSGVPADIARDVPHALGSGPIDTMRFTAAPTSDQIDEILTAGREHENKEADRIFGADANNAKKWMRSNSEKASEKLEELVQKYGPEAEGFVYGTGGYPIVNDEDLKSLRRRISDIEFAVDNASVKGDYTDLTRELAWAAPKLPDINVPDSLHTIEQRQAVLVVARAFEDMQAKVVDAQKAFRGAVDYTMGRIGDVDDVKTLLDRLGQFAQAYLHREAEFLKHEAETEKTVAGEQTIIPGVKPVTDADRAQAGAEKPMRGGAGAPPAGGLFDEDAKAQIDWMDLVPTDDGLIPINELKEQLKPQTSEEKTFFQLATDLFGNPITPESVARQKRQNALALYAQSNLVRYLNAYRTIDGRRDIIQASYNLFENFGHSGNPSVRFLAEALTARTNAKIAEALEHFARKTFYSDGSLVGGRRNRADFAELQRAMFGEKTTPDMQRMAKDILDALNDQRILFNEKAGDTIPELANWGGPQSHNATAVYRAGGAKNPATAKANWTVFIDPLLDWTKMRDAQSGQLYARQPSHVERQRILESVWDDIVTDGNISLQPGQQHQGSSVANSRSDSRFFVFKDADSKIAYNKNYGEGDLMSQIAGHVRLMARDTALMTIFGPNPRAMVDWLKGGINKEVAKYTVGQPALLEGYKYDKNYLDGKATHAGTTLDGYYQQFRGSNFAQGKIALAGTVLRNVAMGSLLGSSVIPHAVSNPFIQMTARYYGGVPIMRAIPRIAQAFARGAKDEMLRSGLDLENGAYSLGESARYIMKMQRWANATRWFPDRVTVWSGLHPFVEANRGAIRRDLVGMFADLQKTDWSQLPRAVLTKMKGYGLTEGDWKIIQAVQPYRPTIGMAPWVRPADIESIAPDAVRTALGNAQMTDPDAVRAARETAIKLGGYIMGETEVAVPSHSMRSRAFIIGDADPNTLWGGLRHSAGLFKGFIGSFFLTQLAANAEQATRGPRFLNPRVFGRRFGLPHAAFLFTAMSVLGTLSFMLKQMAAGKETPSLDPATPEGRKTWLHGALTGGSFGWMGDFLASDQSSYGRGPLESLAGAPASTVIDMFQTGVDAFTAATTKPKTSGHLTAKEKAIEGMFRAARANTPALSTLWYARAAFNRMVLDQLQQMADPNGHNAMRLSEQRLLKENNQKFWWKPGAIMPHEYPWQHDGR